jgi:hypothetical protein
VDGRGRNVQAIHVIYRLDFPRNYSLIDGVGQVSKILMEQGASVFSDYGEDVPTRKLIARAFNEERSVFRSMTVEPTTIVLDFESAHGFELRRLEDIDDFRSLLELAEQVVTQFKVTKITRAGLRFFFVGIGPGSFEAAKDRTVGELGKVLVAPARKLGPISDVGLSLDGRSDDGISYHYRGGPFQRKNDLPRVLQQVHEQFPEDAEYDLLLDLDQYEESFNYGPSNIKWWRPIAETARAVASDFESAFRREQK